MLLRARGKEDGTPSNEALEQAVLAGLGYSIMPIIGIKNEINCGKLPIIDSPGLPIRSTRNLIRLKNKRFSSVAEASSVIYRMKRAG